MSALSEWLNINLYWLISMERPDCSPLKYPVGEWLDSEGRSHLVIQWNGNCLLFRQPWCENTKLWLKSEEWSKVTTCFHYVTRKVIFGLCVMCCSYLFGTAYRPAVPVSAPCLLLGTSCLRSHMKKTLFAHSYRQTHIYLRMVFWNMSSQCVYDIVKWFLLSNPVLLHFKTLCSPSWYN